MGAVQSKVSNTKNTTSKVPDMLIEKITPDKWKTFSSNQQYILSHTNIQHLISDNFLTLKEVVDLDTKYSFEVSIEYLISTLIKNKLIKDGFLSPDEARTPNDEARTPNIDHDTQLKLIYEIPGLIKKGLIVPLALADESAIRRKTMTCRQALDLPHGVLLDIGNDTVSSHIQNENITIYDIIQQYEYFAEQEQDETSSYDMICRTLMISMEQNLKSTALRRLIDQDIYPQQKPLYLYNRDRQVLEMPGVVDLIISKKEKIGSEEKNRSSEFLLDPSNWKKTLKTFIRKIANMDKESLKELESKELRDIIIAGKLSLDQIEGFSKLPEMIKETTIQHIQDLIEKDPVAALKFIEKIYPPQREENLVQVKYDLNAVHNEMYPLIVKAMVATERSTSIHEKEDVISKITERQDNYRKCKSYLTSRRVPRTLRDYLKKLDIVYRTVALDKNTLDGLKTKTFNTANKYIKMFKEKSLVEEKRDLDFQMNHGLFNTQPQPQPREPVQLGPLKPPTPGPQGLFPKRGSGRVSNIEPEEKDLEPEDVKKESEVCTVVKEVMNSCQIV